VADAAHSGVSASDIRALFRGKKLCVESRQLGVCHSRRAGLPSAGTNEHRFYRAPHLL